MEKEPREGSREEQGREYEEKEKMTWEGRKKGGICDREREDRQRKVEGE